MYGIALYFFRIHSHTDIEVRRTSPVRVIFPKFDTSSASFAPKVKENRVHTNHGHLLGINNTTIPIFHFILVRPIQ